MVKRNSSSMTPDSRPRPEDITDEPTIGFRIAGPRRATDSGLVGSERWDRKRGAMGEGHLLR